MMTLKELKEKIEELIKYEGEESPCLSFLFTAGEDMWWWENDNMDVRCPGIPAGSDPQYPSEEICGEVFDKAEQVFDYISPAVLCYCIEKAKDLHYTKHRHFVNNGAGFSSGTKRV